MNVKEGQWAKLKSTKQIKSLVSTFVLETVGGAKGAKHSICHLQVHYSVRTFRDVVKKLLASMRRTPTPYAMAVISTSRLTQQNTTYGKLNRKARTLWTHLYCGQTSIKRRIVN